jgi:hypothetical protein
MQEIFVKSIQESEEDSVVWVHETADSMLRQLCCGRLLYIGQQRKRLEYFRATAEAVILGERPAPRLFSTQFALSLPSGWR